MHAGHVLRPGRRDGVGERHVPGPGREHERPVPVQLPVRRDGPERHGHPFAEPGFERLVQPFALGRLLRLGRRLRNRVLRPRTDVLRPRLGERLGVGLLPGSRGQHRFAGLFAEVRRDRAGRHRDSIPRSRLERLVQPHADGQLQRHGCDVRPRFLRPGSELLRSRRRDCLCDRFLHRHRRERDRAGLRAQLRRDRAGGVRKPRPRPGLARLVQPRAHGHLQRDGCHIRARLVRPAADLRRPRRRRGVGQRLLRGSRREHDHTRFWAELRRDRAGGQRDAGPRAGLERLVQPCALSRLQRRRCNVGGRLLRATADVLRPRRR